MFGKNKKINDQDTPQVAVMAIFAGEDTIPGATSSDAAVLQNCLEADDNVIDHMVKVWKKLR